MEFCLHVRVDGHAPPAVRLSQSVETSQNDTPNTLHRGKGSILHRVQSKYQPLSLLLHASARLLDFTHIISISHASLAPSS
jgi:hypothetical protein